ncbi:MAG: HEAT repeat domain-containing protein, partial [Planctomycetaceae bacterium]
TGRGDEKVALHLAEFASKERDPRVVLEVIVALGRLRWRDAPNWLRKHWHVFKTGDALEHAAMQLLRRSDNWPAVFKLLDHSAKGGSKRVGLRAIALRALAGRSDPIVVDGLIRRFETETTAARRRDYVDALARVYKKPAPWTYWGFRPAPRPANSVAWKRTETIGKTLDRALADPDVAVRATALKRMQREMVPIRPATLDRWLRTETDATHLRAILVALKGFPPSDVRGSLERIVRDRKRAVSNRLAALATFAGGLDKDAADRLLAAAKTLEDGPVLAAALRAMERRTSISSDRFLLAKLGSRNAAVRAAAIEMLARRRVAAASGRVVGLLSDPDVRVRRAASFAAGTLRVSQGVDRLRALAGGDDRESCRLSLESLNSLRDSRAVPQAVAALKHPETQLAALEYLEAFGGSKQAGHLTRLADSARSSDVMIGIARALSKWSSVLPPQSRTRRQLERAVATVHRKSGVLLHWSVIGPLSAEKADRVAKQLATVLPGDPIVSPKKWRSHIAVGTDAAIRLPAGAKASAGSSWLAVSHLYSETPAKVEFLTSSSGTMRIRLNGRQVFRKSKPGAYRADAERFDASLVKGNNRLLVRIDGPSRGTTFHLRFRTKSSKAEHERLVQLALRGRGSALRGREVFRDAKKANCLNCHRLGAAGGNIGPDLTGVGRRFSKIHIVEAILEPSRTIAPSYATVSVALSSGRVLSGVRIAETTTQLTLGDNQGKIHTIAKSEIERTRVQSKSTMPEGIEKQLTDRQFLDLIAFLQSQKKRLSKR